MRTFFLALMVIALVIVGAETFFHKEEPFPTNTTYSIVSTATMQTDSES